MEEEIQESRQSNSTAHTLTTGYTTFISPIIRQEFVTTRESLKIYRIHTQISIMWTFLEMKMLW